MQDYSFSWIVRVKHESQTQDLQINADSLTVDRTGLHAYATRDNLRLVFIPLDHIVWVQVMNIDGYANGFEFLGVVE